MDNGEELPTRSAMLRLTQLFNITGHPAISLPLPTDGLPVGLQLVGRRDRTGELLQVAAACEGRLRV
jgi:aspartyl-tRNA(Asn)/glutamyl-tRNA(Gln) amidotransferase subunit A